MVGAQLLHHTGRITSYAVIGFVLASAGSMVTLAGVGRGLQATLSVLVGALMVLIGFGLVGWLPTRRWVESRRLAGTVVRATARLRDSTRGRSWFLVGVANGFLPCGPVYAVAAGTVVATPLAGAAAMILFGLGTIPALVVFAVGAGRLSPTIQRRFNRLAAVLVMLIGVQLICRGAAAFGWIGHLRFGEVVIW
jgi:sulfite exporter TauE/SafE